MSNRWLRFGIALLALAAAGAAGYRIVQQEQRVRADSLAARSADASAETALVAISELKAALHAYVAEGQGHAFWTARAATLIERLRASVLELDGPAAAAGVSSADALDTIDRVAAAEQRARTHARSDERLLAGEVIFTEARDLLDATRLQVAQTRTAIGNAWAASEAEVRREQAMLALGAGGILAFAALLLVIPGTARTESTAAVTVATPASVAVSADDQAASARISGRTPAPARSPEASVPAVAAPAAATISLTETAAVCTDLGRVSQSVELSALLERAAKVLGASGAIVWMAGPDAREMYPAASAGYDERLLTRIGALARDANNVTAAAFRDAAPRTSPGLGPSAAALAVPLMTPLGPVGVLSAEIREVANVDDARLSVATIFAAQLATLLGSMAAPAPAESDERPAAAKAQA